MSIIKIEATVDDLQLRVVWNEDATRLFVYGLWDEAGYDGVRYLCLNLAQAEWVRNQLDDFIARMKFAQSRVAE